MSKTGRDSRENGRGPQNRRDAPSSVTAAIDSKWSGRFTWTAMIQGAIIAALTLMLALISAITLLPQNLVEIVLSRPAIGFSEVTALAGWVST